MDAARAPLTTRDSPAEVAATPPLSMTSSDESPKSDVKRSFCVRCLRGSVPYVRDVLLTLCAVAVVLMTRRLGPASPGFFCHDSGITYPYRGDTVSVAVLALMTVFVPPAVISAVELLQQRRGWGWSFARPLWTTAVLSTRHLVCQAFLFAVIEVVKSLVSRPRPCFLDLCRPVDYNQTLCDTRYFISEFRCGALSATSSQEQRLLVQDSMLSFPSGHATIATCTATFMALYLSSRCRGRRLSVLRVFLTACCVLYSCAVSFSRVADHRHHLTDVLAGMLLGSLAGVALSYGVCREALSDRSGQRQPLVAQTSVMSNRTSDTQTTSIDDV